MDFMVKSARGEGFRAGRSRGARTRGRRRPPCRPRPACAARARPRGPGKATRKSIMATWTRGLDSRGRQARTPRARRPGRRGVEGVERVQPDVHARVEGHRVDQPVDHPLVGLAGRGGRQDGLEAVARRALLEDGLLEQLAHRVDPGAQLGELALGGRALAEGEAEATRAHAPSAWRRKGTAPREPAPGGAAAARMDVAHSAWPRWVSFSVSMWPITRARSRWDGAAEGSASSAARVRRSDSNSRRQLGAARRCGRASRRRFLVELASASSAMRSQAGLAVHVRGSF
jgi:hypothetical protein